MVQVSKHLKYGYLAGVGFALIASCSQLPAVGGGTGVGLIGVDEIVP